ncbi:hypothetical protein I204_04223 [Kwoniella mangroviensis CBS 8886]|nr:hypothetical protein I204_04223 [Kwoniella mangroviensis CBS 8886]
MSSSNESPYVSKEGNEPDQSSRELLDDRDGLDPFRSIWFVRELKARQEPNSEFPHNFNDDPTKTSGWTANEANSDTLSDHGQQDDHPADAAGSNASEHPTDDRGNPMPPSTSTSIARSEGLTPSVTKDKQGPDTTTEESNQGSVMLSSTFEGETNPSVNDIQQSWRRPRAWASLFQPTKGPCTTSTAGASASVSVEITSASGVSSTKEATGTGLATESSEGEKVVDEEGEFVTVIRGKRQSQRLTDQQHHQFAEEDSRHDVYSYDDIGSEPKDEDWYLQQELALQNASFTRKRYGVNPNRQASSKKRDMDNKTHWGRGFR